MKRNACRSISQQQVKIKQTFINKKMNIDKKNKLINEYK